MRGLVARVAVLLECAADDTVQFRRGIGTGTAKRRRCCVRDRGHHRDLVFAGKRQAAGDHLVQHDAERPDIGPHIAALADEMLGRHVGDGADRRAGARQRRAAGQLGDAEVEDLHLAATREHDVRRLDVAMDDVGVVRGRDRARTCIATSSASSIGIGPRAIRSFSVSPS